MYENSEALGGLDDAAVDMERLRLGQKLPDAPKPHRSETRIVRNIGCEQMCRSVAVKKASKCELRAFPTLSRTLMRTLNRHPYSDTLNRPASTEAQEMDCQVPPGVGFDPDSAEDPYSERACGGRGTNHP